jgi:UDP:flavonoid glycosyltransferase YjiC (YdhE family)
MRFLFVIQGEGRGHMTQAMALYQLLSRRGHEVCDVVIGTSDRREIPSFFNEQIHCPIHRIQSPNFVTDSRQKSIRIGATISKNLRQLPAYYDSLIK